MTVDALTAALEDLTPPCEVFRCGMYQACAGGLACDSFVRWVRTGKLVPTPDRPNRMNYSEVFPCE